MRTTPILIATGLLVLGLLALTPNASAYYCTDPSANISPSGCVTMIWYDYGAEDVYYRVVGDTNALCTHYLGDCPLARIY